MTQGSDKHGPKLDDELESETEPPERSGKEARAEEARRKEADGPAGSGHRVQGSGSSADDYTYKDHGEVGGSSHPQPRDPEEHSEA